MVGNVNTMIIFFEKLLIYSSNLLMLIIIVDALLSFIPHNPDFLIIRIIRGVSESILRHLRSISPASGIGFDFSPLVAIILIKIFQELVLLLARWFV
ncbi:MAG: YggT family protein [Oligoflexia bacterium]|nr:YggT family protein [Oligoflexia bacterium]